MEDAAFYLLVLFWSVVIVGFIISCIPPNPPPGVTGHVAHHDVPK